MFAAPRRQPYRRKYTPLPTERERQEAAQERELAIHPPQVYYPFEWAR